MAFVLVLVAVTISVALLQRDGAQDRPTVRDACRAAQEYRSATTGREAAAARADLVGAELRLRQATSSHAAVVRAYVRELLGPADAYRPDRLADATRSCRRLGVRLE